MRQRMAFPGRTKKKRDAAVPRLSSNLRLVILDCSYHTWQRSAGGRTIAESSLQLKASLNSGKLESGPITRILADRMRIALHHGALRFRTNLIATPLSPGNKELLLRSVAVDGWFRMCLRRFLEGKISRFLRRQNRRCFRPEPASRCGVCQAR